MPLAVSTSFHPKFVKTVYLGVQISFKVFWSYAVPALDYVHTVPDSERKKLIRYIVNRNKCSVALQVLHLLNMEQSSPALEQKLFQK